MRERTRGPTDAGGEPVAGDDELAGSGRARLLAIVVVVVALLGLLAVAFTPRTLAEIGEGERSWRLTVTPGIVDASIELIGPDGASYRATDGGLQPPLDTTQLWSVRPTQGGEPTTLVVGAMPPGADSVRVTSEVEGVGEARVQRVAWRRVHVTVIEAATSVEELVAISEDGRVLAAVSELPAPTDVPD